MDISLNELAQVNMIAQRVRLNSPTCDWIIDTVGNASICSDDAGGAPDPASPS